MASNDRVGISFAQPHQLGERTTLAHKCSASLEINMPLLVDAMDDRVGHLYSGMPDRLYVIDRAGRITYKSGRGPFGFKPGEMEQSLVMTLLDELPSPQLVTRHGIRLLSAEETWKHLPKADKGAGQPLPTWARALAQALPRTTAAMLELDYLQRTRSPIAPKLRAKMRWMAAHENRCAYTEVQAAGDLRRAGGNDADLRALAGSDTGWPAAERNALLFARRMCLEADAVSDQDVAALKKQYGDNQLVAMVLLLAYANFQDRLVLSLGLDSEGDSPPREIRFGKNPASIPAPARSIQQDERIPTIVNLFDDSEWQSLDFSDLQEEMEGQRNRQPRIRVPTWDEVKKHLPPGSPPRAPLQIRWSLVCMGYQPELAMGWGGCMRSFAEEAKQDRVFEESLFWVITRTLHCFY